MNRGIFLATFAAIGLIHTASAADSRFGSPESVIRSVLQACHENDWIAFNEAGLADIDSAGGFVTFREKVLGVDDLKLEPIAEPKAWESYSGKHLGMYYRFAVTAVSRAHKTAYSQVEFPLWDVTVRCAETTRYAILDLFLREHPIHERYCVIDDLAERAKL